MGTRIHKCIGYGLTDVKTDGHRITDDRFHDLGPRGMETMDDDSDFFKWAEQIWTKEDFTKYVKAHMKWAGIHMCRMERIKQWDMSDMLIHQGEYGLENVFLIIPPGHPDWRRFNDIIDYVEAGGIAKDSVKPLQQGIWPYNGMHQNQHGERLDSAFSCEWWRCYNSVLDGDVSQEQIQGMNIILHSISVKMGFKGFHDAKYNMAPLIPDILRVFCEWLGIFTDPDTIDQLRPMIYTYWS